MNRRFVDTYQKSAVVGASPLELVLMLYDGAIAFCEKAKASMLQKDRFQQNAELLKAQRILTELTSCLDFENGGEIAQNLLALYTFGYNELVMANLQDDPAGVDRCRQVLVALRESWSEIHARLKSPDPEDELAA